MIDTRDARKETKAVVEASEQSLAMPDEEQVPDYTVPVVLFFGGSVPLVALTQFLGLGAPGFVASAVGAGLLAMCGGFLKEKIFDYLPGLRTYGEGMTWGRFFQALGEDGMTVDADPVEERAQPKDEPDLYVDPAEADTYDWYDDDDDGPDLPAMDSSMFTFSHLLASGFRPTLRKIFLGRLGDGTDVFVEAKDLCHVALAGNTGNGKSSLLRLIMAQLCAIRVSVVLLNPHYMIYDRDHDEDWTPYTPYLARNPLDYVTPDAIVFMLKWICDKTLARRMELARRGESVGKPYFVVIDELPAIVGERKDCVTYIAKLLREGRKYGIYLIVASQDFLVKSIGLDDKGGAVRKCFRTACYVGGDLTTANVLLEKQVAAIPETDLGKGKMMLRCSTTRQAVLASVPYCDNEALYSLLGPSTFEEVATSFSPSVPTSPATSELGDYVEERNPSTGGTKGEEVGLPLRQFSELEMRVEELFIQKGMNPAAIVRELWPEIKGGDAYQKKSVEVADAIRAIYKARTTGEA